MHISVIKTHGRPAPAYAILEYEEDRSVGNALVLVASLHSIIIEQATMFQPATTPIKRGANKSPPFCTEKGKASTPTPMHSLAKFAAA
mmetsp:Transcript_16933/g.28696  ORF Transcript_16933/g.28696 Transcript_16933/m.28696 type:complete len:88 (+) Transcript_16933:2124-2387(+)